MNLRLTWTKSDSCWPASFNIFDQLLAEYSIEFESQFEKRHVPFPCWLAFLSMLRALVNNC
jgi:hypothetical protein